MPKRGLKMLGAIWRGTRWNMDEMSANRPEIRPLSASGDIGIVSILP